jgi:hypothetical protein
VTGKVKLQECHESDQIKREAKFALRSTDLQIWKKYFASRGGHEFTSMDPLLIQHWSLVVHFLDGDKTFFFEAVDDKGKLQAHRAENVEYQVFENATYFDSVDISPYELLEKAKEVSSNGIKYCGLYNNCQSWVKEFLGRISPKLLNSLIAKISNSDSTWDIDFFLTNVMQSIADTVKMIKLDECEEEFDQTEREAQFAFQLRESSPKLRSPSTVEDDTELDQIQHCWALIIHFPRGKKTYIFQAWKDDAGLLQPGRAEGVKHKVFEKATHFGTAITSPSKVLEIAKTVPLNGTAYNSTSNNSKSWLHEFLTRLSPGLLSSLFEKEPSITTNADN